MPHFIAPRSHCCNLVGEVFALEVLPYGSDFEAFEATTAYIAFDLFRSTISRELAEEFGVTEEGAELSLIIRQWNPLTERVHAFEPISLRPRFAHPRLGRNYIQLGMEDLLKFFKVSRFQSTSESEVPFLFLFPQQGYGYWCRHGGAALSEV